MKRRHKIGIAALVVGGVAAWALRRRDKALNQWDNTFTVNNRVRLERQVKEAGNAVSRTLLKIFKTDKTPVR